MLKSLNFKHIFYFWVVARESSIRKASTLLNVAPSSISEQIKVLEHRLGLELFDRSQKKMLLNSEGQVLFQNLDQFFPKIEELFESLKSYKSVDAKFLKIGLCPTLSSSTRHQICYPLIEDPHYTVKIVQGENAYLTEAFDKDEIDILFTTNKKLSLHGKYNNLELAKQDFCIVTNKNVFDQLPKSNPKKKLNDYKYINYTQDSDLHFQVYNWLNKNKLSPIRIAEIDDISIIKNTIKAFDCFSILPINAIKEEIDNKQLYQVGGTLKSIKCNIHTYYKSKFESERFREHLNSISKNI